MSGRKLGLPWPRRSGEAAPAPAGPLPPAAPALPRPPVVEHHWLTVAVVRSGPAQPLPVGDARVVVRPFPRGAQRPGEPVARGSTGHDGSFALLLPAGRYAVSATHGGEGRAVTITLEHSGRAMLVLESLGRRVVLTVEVAGPAGEPLAEATVDVRTVPGGTHAARGVTDERGVAAIHLPAGAYEVRVGGSAAKTYLEADTLLRLTAEPAPPEPAAPAVSRYAQRARAATSYVAPLDIANVREDSWN